MPLLARAIQKIQTGCIARLDVCARFCPILTCLHTQIQFNLITKQQTGHGHALVEAERRAPKKASGL